jgi:membrane-associated phospholipid phosphatase
MTQCREPFLAWPGWDLLVYTLRVAGVVALWWVVVYHGADHLTGLRAQRVRIHLDHELAMPFVPAFILAYLSLDLVFALAPFILRSRYELQALALTLAAVIAVAGVGFLLIPAQPAYAIQDAGAWTSVFRVARVMSLRYNMVPSLHVTMSFICLAAYGSHCGGSVKWLLGIWGVLIALSTLLTHQHHLLDVATGLILASAGKRFIYDRLRSRSSAGRTDSATQSAGPEPLA